MTGLKARWNRIPRWLRVCLNVLVAAVLLLAIYVGAEAPYLTIRQGLRQAEQRNMVGPGTVRTVMDLDAFFYGRLLVAETDYAIEFFAEPASDGFKGLNPKFSYQDKTGDLTVAAPPIADGVPMEFYTGAIEMPVFLFHRHPEAARAELQLQFPDDLTVSLQSEESGDGYFCFWMRFDAWMHFDEENDGRPSDPECKAAETLCRICDAYSMFHDRDSVISAQVRFYDGADRLVEEREFEIQSVLNR